MNGSRHWTGPTTTMIDPSSFPDDSCRCFHCGCTKPFYTDTAQGDLICTVCGVVQAESLLDTSPEWHNYADEPTNTGRARCGMVPTDETKWLGGLEPTRLSQLPFGGGPDRTAGGVRQTLQRIQHRTDAFLNQTQKRAWESAEAAVDIAKRNEAKRQKQQQRSTEDVESSKPEYDASADTDWDEKRLSYDLVVVEEDEQDPQPELAEQVRQLSVKRQQLYAEKWSLQRALEQPTSDDVIATLKKTKKLSRKEEEALQKAASSLREAYDALRAAATALPPHVLEHAADRLEQYATQRDGLPKDKIALAAALLGRQTIVSKKLYHKAVKELQKYKLFRAASIEEWIRPLELPTTAEAVVLHLLERKGSKAVAKKAYAAALTYVVCSAGGRSQQWATAAQTTTVAWDAWREELVWKRSPTAIAKAFDVPEAQVRQQYATAVFPERQILLQEATDTATPLKTVLLPQLSAAAATLRMSDFDDEMKFRK